MFPFARPSLIRPLLIIAELRQKRAIESLGWEEKLCVPLGKPWLRVWYVNVDVLVLQRFVSFLGLKNEAIYTCVLSLFRRAFVPFYSFTVLVSTRGFKRASLELGPGDFGFKERVKLRVYRAWFDSWL